MKWPVTIVARRRRHNRQGRKIASVMFEASVSDIASRPNQWMGPVRVHPADREIGISRSPSAARHAATCRR